MKQDASDFWIDYRTAHPHRFPRLQAGPFPAEAIVRLSETERRAALEAALILDLCPYRADQQEGFVEAAGRLVAEALEPATRSRIRRVLDEGLGGVLLDNLPVDAELPRTPASGGSLPVDAKGTFVTEALLLGLGTLFDSEPFNFHQEGEGTAPLIDNIVPVKRLRTQKGAGGYDGSFPFHCESAWHRKSPDYLALIGIRGHPQATTLLFSVEHFEGGKFPLDTLPPDDHFRLRAPDLYLQMEAAGQPMGTARHVERAPIQVDGANLELKVNFNGTSCHDRATVDWLRGLEEFIEGQAVGAVLDEGNALILNNRRTCHSRTGYEPAFDGFDRWFARAYFKRDLWARDPSLVPVEVRRLADSFRPEMLARGWLDDDGQLTQGFVRCVEDPEALRALSPRDAELASVAFHFTPVAGSRIV